jgi:hypothetical protein
MKVKSVRLPPEVIDIVQIIADRDFGGRWADAVRYLLLSGGTERISIRTGMKKPSGL